MRIVNKPVGVAAEGSDESTIGNTPELKKKRKTQQKKEKKRKETKRKERNKTISKNIQYRIKIVIVIGRMSSLLSFIYKKQESEHFLSKFREI